MSFQFSYHLLGLIWALIGLCGLDHYGVWIWTFTAYLRFL